MHPRPRVPPLLEVRVPHPAWGPATSGEKRTAIRFIAVSIYRKKE